MSGNLVYLTNVCIIISHNDNNNKNNKAIVDYTSRVLCTPVTPFPPIGDAAYRQHAGGGPSHGHTQHAQKIARVIPEISSRTDRQTDTETGILITILRNRSRGRSDNIYTLLSGHSSWLQRRGKKTIIFQIRNHSESATWPSHAHATGTVGECWTDCGSERSAGGGGADWVLSLVLGASRPIDGDLSWRDARRRSASTSVV